MERRDAADWYKFDDAYFDGLRDALGDHLHLAVARVDEQIAAAGLFSECDGIVKIRQLSGSDERFRTARPTKLLYDGVRTWAKQRAARWFHRGRDSVCRRTRSTTSSRASPRGAATS